MKLLYTKTSLWEYDFIVNDILYEINLEIELFNRDEFKLLSNREDIIENNILVINSVYNLDEIIDVVKRIKPIIIFYFSDEYGDKKDVMILEKYTKLLLRQYNHPHYNYSNNNYHLPLGYSKYFTGGNNSLCISKKKIIDREFNCSFIGTIKSDRIKMIDIFKNQMNKTNIMIVENNWDIDNLPCSPEKCFNIYNNSIFIICGRGNSSLDCFRIYEAIVAGAIPVIVGSINEINITFNYDNNIIPFVHADSWEEAIIICNNLLKDYSKLQEIQDNLFKWWSSKIIFINSLIQNKIKIC
jgi:hypothetical protein